MRVRVHLFPFSPLLIGVIPATNASTRAASRTSGQGQTQGTYQGHCGQHDCPICVTFGFTKGEGGSFQGLAQFSDARLIFFPVHSLAGPVWVTCPSILKDLGIEKTVPNDGTVCVANGVTVQGKLNLGWLMLSTQTGFAPDNSKLNGVPEEVLSRAVLVSDKLFSQIVNDNLEVRTSVSIDPSTGAAAEGALFTYEALPRGTVVVFEVVMSDPKYYCIHGKRPFTKDQPCMGQEKSSPDPPNDQENTHAKDGKRKVKATVEKGLRFLEALGVGGMGTRGMGRLRVLGLSDVGGSQ